MVKARRTSTVQIDAQNVFALSLVLDCNYYIEVQGGLVVLVVEGKNCAVAANKEHRLEQMGSGHLADGDRVSFLFHNLVKCHTTKRRHQQHNVTKIYFDWVKCGLQCSL